MGDEDLLEIIGNSKDVRLVQRHFPKMFAGITSLRFENEGDMLLGMFSREGEFVEFSKEILISEDPTIHVWLTKIESSMQMSLAERLNKAINEMLIINIEDEQDEYANWIEKYPAQIVVLSMQVSWSNQIEERLK